MLLYHWKLCAFKKNSNALIQRTLRLFEYTIELKWGVCFIWNSSWLKTYYVEQLKNGRVFTLTTVSLTIGMSDNNRKNTGIEISDGLGNQLSEANVRMHLKTYTKCVPMIFCNYLWHKYYPVTVSWRYQNRYQIKNPGHPFSCSSQTQTYT